MGFVTLGTGTAFQDGNLRKDWNRVGYWGPDGHVSVSYKLEQGIDQSKRLVCRRWLAVRKRHAAWWWSPRHAAVCYAYEFVIRIVVVLCCGANLRGLVGGRVRTAPASPSRAPRPLRFPSGPAAAAGSSEEIRLVHQSGPAVPFGR